MAFTIVAGEKTVADTGTPEALVASETLTQKVIIQAKTGNGSALNIGHAGAQTFTLVAGASIELSNVLAPVDSSWERENKQDATDIVPVQYIDLASIYVDVGTNGNGVNFLYTVET